jgi:hypothetical protein
MGAACVITTSHTGSSLGNMTVARQWNAKFFAIFCREVIVHLMFLSSCLFKRTKVDAFVVPELVSRIDRREIEKCSSEKVHTVSYVLYLSWIEIFVVYVTKSLRIF